MTLGEYLEKFPNFAEISPTVIEHSVYWMEGLSTYRPHMMFVCPTCGRIWYIHTNCRGTSANAYEPVEHSKCANVPIPELMDFLIARSAMMQ